MTEILKPPIYHSGLCGLRERVVWNVTQSKAEVEEKVNGVKTDMAVKIVSSPYIRSRFSELTRGRFFPEPGALQRMSEAKKRGKKLVVLANHASIAIGLAAIEAANQTIVYLNQDPEINMTGVDMTLAESINTGEQGPVNKAGYNSAMLYANGRGVEAIEIERKGEYGKSKGNGERERVSSPEEQERKKKRLLDKDRILVVFAEGTVESGRFATEIVQDKNKKWIEKITRRRKGLQEIGKTGKVDQKYLYTLLERFLKEYAVSWLNADGEIELLDPVTRRPHLKAVGAALGLWSRKFIRIKMTPPITNEKVAEDIGKWDVKGPIKLKDYIKTFTNYFQSAGAQGVSPEKQGDFQEVMEI